MKSLYLIVVCAGVILCSACHSPELPQMDQAPHYGSDSLFHVKEGPFEFSILLPKDLMINDQPQLRFNQATGQMQVFLGREFRLVAVAERVSRSQIEAELMDDGIFTNRIESEKDGIIIYQQFLPTGEPWYFQVIGKVRAGGREYLFRSDPVGEYTLFQAERMAAAVRRLADGAI